MGSPRVVGIVLARNEERYIESAVRQASVFCDSFLFCDNGSTDRTPAILRSLARELPDASFHALRHPRESHELVAPLCGSNTWVFGVDGDEIYDAAGLVRLKARIRAGEFDGSFTVFGNVLNVTRLDEPGEKVWGHLAPPCRSMTKLYNFAALESWGGACPERLHGGHQVFRAGFEAGSRRYLHEEVPWEESDFRCLHLCFLPRSSAEDTAARPNIMETYGAGAGRRTVLRLRRLLGISGPSRWKNERYRRGPEVEKDLSPFLREGKL